ncbi:hypothetical protein DPEC_G00346500 [Dallia pectoralis]|uniref:Uncharacterized protein n=1 Tax=Dallia pectoralis TaxID=75939 RepID=A0ACC2F3U5_DALPE|nr:hypothetical protein DPEC_G00346500 [Dallia pectoralis]
MKYQKYITVIQMAMGVNAVNRDNCIPPKRQMWVTPTDGVTGIGATWIGTAATSSAITEAQESAAAAEERAALARAAARARAMGGAGAMGGATVMFATSTLSLPVTQGKPSLRRIKGRIHRSKSLDSIDLLDSSTFIRGGPETSSVSPPCS